MSSVCSFFWPTLYINFQYVCGIHVVGNEMKWFTFLCATLYVQC